MLHFCHTCSLCSNFLECKDILAQCVAENQLGFQVLSIASDSFQFGKNKKKGKNLDQDTQVDLKIIYQYLVLGTLKFSQAA